MTEVEALELQLDEARAAVQIRDEILELNKSPLYRKYILEGFIKTDCAFYTHSSGDPSLSENARKDALNIAQAAGHFRRYMSIKIIKGNQAEEMLERLQEAIDNQRAEDANKGE